MKSRVLCARIFYPGIQPKRLNTSCVSFMSDGDLSPVDNYRDFPFTIGMFQHDIHLFGI